MSWVLGVGAERGRSPHSPPPDAFHVQDSETDHDAHRHPASPAGLLEPGGSAAKGRRRLADLAEGPGSERKDLGRAPGSAPSIVVALASPAQAGLPEPAPPVRPRLRAHRGRKDAV